MTPVLRKDLNLSTQQLGVIGSLVFFGLLCGSVGAAFVFGKYSYKKVMLLTYIINAIFLILFAATEIYWLQCLSRFLAGYAQVFQCIYFPLFIDTYSTTQNKSHWMSFMLLSPPLGVILGYTMTYVIMKHSTW